jgi:Lon protease-like protein
VKLPLFPLHTVLFPGMLLPLHIFEPRYREMINLCVQTSLPFGVALIRAGVEVGGPAEPHPIGTYAAVSRVERLPDGRMNIQAIGQERFRILDLHHDQAYLTGTVERFPLLESDDPAARRAARKLMPWLEQYLSLLGQAAESPFDPSRLPTDPAALAYLAAIVAQVAVAEKQTLLAIRRAADLLEHERALYRREVSLLREMLRRAQPPGESPFSPN